MSRAQSHTDQDLGLRRRCAETVVNLMEQSRLLVSVASVGLLATAGVTVVWGTVLAAEFAYTLFDGGWLADDTIVDLLVVIDTYLLAAVQVVVALGLFELFVRDLELPDWLETKSLSDLKEAIVDLLVVFLAIKFVEKLLAVTDPIDALKFAGAVAAIIVSLSVYTAAHRQGHR